MRCTAVRIEIDGGIFLHLGFENESGGFVGRASIKSTPYEARLLAGELMEAATDAEAIARDEELDRTVSESEIVHADDVPAETLEER